VVVVVIGKCKIVVRRMADHIWTSSKRAIAQAQYLMLTHFGWVIIGLKMGHSIQ
jgi:hypothetical protein